MGVSAKHCKTLSVCFEIWSYFFCLGLRQLSTPQTLLVPISMLLLIMKSSKKKTLNELSYETLRQFPNIRHMISLDITIEVKLIKLAFFTDGFVLLEVR